MRRAGHTDERRRIGCYGLRAFGNRGGYSTGRYAFGAQGQSAPMTCRGLAWWSVSARQPTPPLSGLKPLQNVEFDLSYDGKNFMILEIK